MSEPVHMDTIERSKENIQPIARGRNAGKLVQAVKDFESHPGVLLGENLEMQRSEFEEKINSYTGDDPIEPWILYLQWIQERFITGGHDSYFLSVVERCVRYFCANTMYQNDVRYLRLWITYADMVRDPIHMFKFIRQQNIGQSLSLYYEAYAHALERKGSYDSAMQVYEEGIRRQASPLDRLKKGFEDFQYRMVERAQKTALTGESDADIGTNSSFHSSRQNENMEASRLALQRLGSNPHAPRPISLFNPNAMPGSMMNQRRRERNQLPNQSCGTGSSSTKNNFTIFDEKINANAISTSDPLLQNVSDDVRKGWNHLPFDGEMQKENSGMASTWTNQTHPIAPSLVSSTQKGPTFSIFVDEDIQTNPNAVIKPNTLSNDSTVLQFISKEEEEKAESLRANPLQNFAKFLKGTKDASADVRQAALAAASMDAAKGKEVRAYRSDSLQTSDGNSELSFEEVRALQLGYYNQIQERRNARLQSSVQQRQLPAHDPEPFVADPSTHSSPCEDENFDLSSDSIEEDNQPFPHGMEDIANSDHTFSTKQALLDVLDMFSAPISSTESRPKKAKPQLSRFEQPNPMSTPQAQSSSVTKTKNSSSSTSFSIFCDIPTISDDQENYDPLGVRHGSSSPLHVPKDRALSELRKTLESDILGDSHSIDLHQNLLVSGLETPQSGGLRKLTNRDMRERVTHSSARKATPNSSSFQLEASFNVSDSSHSSSSSFSSSSPAQDEPAMKKQTTQKIGGPLSVAPGFSSTSFSIFDDNMTPQVRERTRTSCSHTPFPGVMDESTIHGRISLDGSHLDESLLGHIPKTPAVLASNSSSSHSRETMQTPRSSLKPLESRLQPTPSWSEDKRASHGPSDGVHDSKPFAFAPLETSLADITMNAETLATFEVPTMPTEAVPGIEQPIACPLTHENRELARSLVKSFIGAAGGYCDCSHKTVAVDIFELFENASNGGEVGLLLDFGDRVVRVVSILGGSSRSVVFDIQNEETATAIGGFVPLALKVSMGSSAWEYYILKRIEQSHRWLPSPICLYDTGEHVSLLMSRNEYPSLERVISLHSQAKKAINETIVVFYGIELCHMVAELHQMGIIHGDISPENLLLRHEESSEFWDDWRPNRAASGWETKGLMMVGFSKAIDLLMYPENVGFLGNESIPQKHACPEMRESKPWKFHLDLYGIARTLFALLHSRSLSESPMDIANRSGHWEPVEPFKRFWNKSMWERVFDILLNAGPTLSHGSEEESCSALLEARRELESFLESNDAKRKSLRVVLQSQIRFIDQSS